MKNNSYQSPSETKVSHMKNNSYVLLLLSNGNRSCNSEITAQIHWGVVKKALFGDGLSKTTLKGNLQEIRDNLRLYLKSSNFNTKTPIQMVYTLRTEKFLPREAREGEVYNKKTLVFSSLLLPVDKSIISKSQTGTFYPVLNRITPLDFQWRNMNYFDEKGGKNKNEH